MLRSVTAGAVAAAMLATWVTPAMAQGYPGGGYGRPGVGYGYGGGWRHDRYRRHDRGSDAGAIIGGIALVGIIAAIASSSSKNRNRSGIDTDDKAADACASAAETRAGRDARVTDIDQVIRTSEGYRVSGTIEARGYDDRDSDRQPFNCTVRYGTVDRVDLGGSYAFRGN